jgi:HAD superfamily hydrolase (TIGR01458 family)
MEYTTIDLVVPDNEMEEDFIDFDLHAENPQAIVLGDMGNLFTFDLLNALFKKILNGAEIVAMHKNKYWHSGNGLTLDLGAFVTALEFATEKEAVVIGKPNPHLFQLAVKPWGLSFQSIYMVGDDIGGDIGGANNVGMQSILVKTGKYREESLKRSEITPDFIINSVADLPELLQLN